MHGERHDPSLPSLSFKNLAAKRLPASLNNPRRAYNRAQRVGVCAERSECRAYWWR